MNSLNERKLIQFPDSMSEKKGLAILTMCMEAAPGIGINCLVSRVYFVPYPWIVMIKRRNIKFKRLTGSQYAVIENRWRKMLV